MDASSFRGGSGSWHRCRRRGYDELCRERGALRRRRLLGTTAGSEGEGGGGGHAPGEAAGRVQPPRRGALMPGA